MFLCSSACLVIHTLSNGNTRLLSVWQKTTQISINWIKKIHCIPWVLDVQPLNIAGLGGLSLVFVADWIAACTGRVEWATIVECWRQQRSSAKISFRDEPFDDDVHRPTMTIVVDSRCVKRCRAALVFKGLPTSRRLNGISSEHVRKCEPSVQFSCGDVNAA